MSRTKHHRRKRRNPTRNQWIAIGVGSAVVIFGGTILVARHRRPALGDGSGTGGTQGTGGPAVGGTGLGTNAYGRELKILCKQPEDLTLDDIARLANGIYVRIWNRELAKLATSPSANDVDNIRTRVANSVVKQLCQPVTNATRQWSLKISQAAWLASQGMSGQ